MPVKNIIPGQRVTKAKLERARELRRDMTPAKTIPWQELRGDKLGVHFRRQQVIKGFIVDFYCHKAALVIEVNGAIHDEDIQKEYDIRREQVLNALGLRVVRFRNKEIEKHLPLVLHRVQELISLSRNSFNPEQGWSEDCT